MVLPSGKTIEVVYFEDLAVAPAAAPKAPAHLPTDLHVCPCCTSGLVYPTRWEEAGPVHWEVHVRCPNCEWIGVGVHAQETVEAFDAQLDAGTEAVVRDLRQLMHANMEAEIGRFVEALAADLIVPEDF